MLETGVGSAVRLEFDFEYGLWPMTVDVSELETALVNLVINARDAMPLGGTITITARNAASRRARIPDFVAISVKDAGPASRPTFSARSSIPSSRPNRRQGHRAWLSQVHGFAHQAGGTVKVESELGTGTKVTILLPRDEIGLATTGERREIGGSGTVLLVEDNPDVAGVSASLLEQLGYTVRRVADAEAALAKSSATVSTGLFRHRDARRDGWPRPRPPAAANRPELPILLATGYSDAAAMCAATFRSSQALRNPPAQPGDRQMPR